MMDIIRYAIKDKLKSWGFFLLVFYIVVKYFGIYK